jgi:hypothetical protein
MPLGRHSQSGSGIAVQRHACLFFEQRCEGSLSVEKAIHGLFPLGATPENAEGFRDHRSPHPSGGRLFPQPVSPAMWLGRDRPRRVAPRRNPPANWLRRPWSISVSCRKAAFWRGTCSLSPADVWRDGPPSRGWARHAFRPDMVRCWYGLSRANRSCGCRFRRWLGD